MKNTISGNPAKAMMKLVVAADSDKVGGVHMVGPECAEIMQARPRPACGPSPLMGTERGCHLNEMKWVWECLLDLHAHTPSAHQSLVLQEP